MKTITLKTLPESTKQEVFDYVANHLLTQGKKSLLDTGVCAYRGLDGMKCAAGVLMSDEEYQPYFEINTWTQLEKKLNKFPVIHADLIRSLQLVHDGMQPENWVNGLKELAQKHKLNYNAELYGNNIS